ncbi:MAG: hypothetical protein FWF95_02630 [Syntrophorhabdaceae bacterium]|nr:hypothetical protein [Syntrophorhabdaceae bacterium]
MKNLRTAKTFAAFLVVAALFAACGSGTGVDVADTVTSPMKTSYLLSWDAPEATVNNETINPLDDLYQYELYVSNSPDFSDDDTPVAFVSAVKDGEGGAKKLVTEFDLALLNLDDDSSTLYVSLKVVGVDGQKSGFMAPVTWDRA